MAIVVRQATVEDAAPMLAYYTRLLDERLPYIRQNAVPSMEDEVRFIQGHSGEEAILFLAEENGRIVGMSGYRIKKHAQERHTCVLGISVDCDCRGTGIGERLISEGIKWCLAQEVIRLELEVLAMNPAVAFYRELGFVEEGRKRMAIRTGDEFEDVIIMAMMLI